LLPPVIILVMAGGVVLSGLLPGVVVLVMAGRDILTGLLPTIVMAAVIGPIVDATVMPSSARTISDAVVVVEPPDILHAARVLLAGPTVVQTLQGTGQSGAARRGHPLLQGFDSQGPASAPLSRLHQRVLPGRFRVLRYPGPKVNVTHREAGSMARARLFVE
jgi:hypothetical protein